MRSRDRIPAIQQAVYPQPATGSRTRSEEIARSLGIGVESMKEHVPHLLRRLDVPDHTVAAVMAVRAGLVEAAIWVDRFQ